MKALGEHVVNRPEREKNDPEQQHAKAGSHKYEISFIHRVRLHQQTELTDATKDILTVGFCQRESSPTVKSSITGQARRLKLYLFHAQRLRPFFRLPMDFVQILCGWPKHATAENYLLGIKKA